MTRFLALGVMTAVLVLAALPAARADGHLSARVLVPAVAPDSPDGGVSTHVRVEVVEGGKGRVFLSTPPLSEPDFEEAIRVAVEAAADLAGKPLEEFDFLVSVDAGPDAIVEGPSIGASAAVAAAAALTGRAVRGDVAITGTVSGNGTLGGVGGLIAKAAGAHAGGAKVLVVPTGEARVKVQNETRIQLGPGEIVLEGPEGEVDLAAVAEEKYDMRVVEARTLADAFEVATSDPGYVPPPAVGEPPEEALPSERHVRFVEVAFPGGAAVAGALLIAAGAWRAAVARRRP